MTDLSQAIWRKARRSAHNGGCVEIAANLPGVAAIRDSKRPEGGAHIISRSSFADFLADVKKRRYDTEYYHVARQRNSSRWTAIRLCESTLTGSRHVVDLAGG